MSRLTGSSSLPRCTWIRTPTRFWLVPIRARTRFQLPRGRPLLRRLPRLRFHPPPPPLRWRFHPQRQQFPRPPLSPRLQLFPLLPTRQARFPLRYSIYQRTATIRLSGTRPRRCPLILPGSTPPFLSLRKAGRSRSSCLPTKRRIQSTILCSWPARDSTTALPSTACSKASWLRPETQPEPAREARDTSLRANFILTSDMTDQALYPWRIQAGSPRTAANSSSRSPPPPSLTGTIPTTPRRIAPGRGRPAWGCSFESKFLDYMHININGERDKQAREDLHLDMVDYYYWQLYSGLAQLPGGVAANPETVVSWNSRSTAAGFWGRPQHIVPVK